MSSCNCHCLITLRCQTTKESKNCLFIKFIIASHIFPVFCRLFYLHTIMAVSPDHREMLCLGDKKSVYANATAPICGLTFNPSNVANSRHLEDKID